MGRTTRRASEVVLGAVLACVALVAVPPAAQADEGLAVASSSTYVLDTEATAIDATVELDLRNVTPDRPTGDGTYQYYYGAFGVPVPAGAQDVRAVSGSGSLAVTLSPTDDPSTSMARVDFPDLTYGASRHITLTYTVPGAPPRSEDITRAGEGYATFVASGVGDAGSNVVRVVAPAGLTFTSTADGFEATTADGTDTWTATTNTDDGGFWALVSLRDPAKVDERPVDVAGSTLVLESYPDDAQWSDFAADLVTDGIPALEDLVGTPWPGGLDRIREDASPSLRGYDGWFDPGDDEIVVTEALDPDLLLHELSHAWLSDTSFDQRWQYEGLAQVVAERAAVGLGGTPTEHDDVSPSDTAAVPLSQWGGSGSSRSTDVDSWAYPAAYRATQALVGDLDDDTFAAVVGAGVRGERAYDPPGATDPAERKTTTWQRWLDLVETRGGVEDAAETYSRWVLTGEERTTLEARAEARADYAELDEGDGVWLPPEGLRRAMTSWDFDEATQVRTAVSDLGADAVAVQEAADSAGLDVPGPVRASYEEADGDEQYAALAASLPAAATAVGAVGEASVVASLDRNPFGRLGAGLLQLENGAERAASLLAAGEIPESQETADAVTSRAGWATPLGVGLPLLVLLVLAGVVVLVVMRRRSSQLPEHPGVPEGVGLDALEVQELRDPLVVGAQQLGVDGGLDRLAVDGLEAVPAEEAGLEGETEQPGQSEVPGALDEPVEEAGPDATPEEAGLHGQRANLPEVLPEDVYGTAADDTAR